jgi:hypothetical protein
MAARAVDGSRDRRLFYLCLAMEVAGSLVILWHGVPIYQRLVAGGPGGAASADFLAAWLAIAAMQGGHWVGFRLLPRLRIRRHVLFGHVLVCIGELSLFFSNALATVVLFERIHELDLTWWKMITLAAILFAVCCYKHQIATLGERMIDAPSDAPSVPRAAISAIGGLDVSNRQGPEERAPPSLH